MTANPIDPFIEHSGVLLLDGGLATELEARGHVLDTALWSAELLLADPKAIRDVHLAYLEAGADCIITASYQASIAGLCERGLCERDARIVLRRSVDLAIEARDLYIDRSSSSEVRQLTPLVAASVGPYGAFLANGAEYRGDYGVGRNVLRDFHAARWEILTGSPVDLLACETIPSLLEAEVLRELIDQTPGAFAWVSFSCRDGERISDGTPLTECAALFDNSTQVVAVGVNCTAPKHVSSLIRRLRERMPSKPLVAYPNSGEVWDGENRRWIGTSDPSNCAIAAQEWYEQGAKLLGGCCRTGPQHISAMRSRLTRQ